MLNKIEVITASIFYYFLTGYFLTITFNAFKPYFQSDLHYMWRRIALELCEFS
jgi:hypothetical protein